MRNSLAIFLLAAAAMPAQAHNQWIKPSAASVSGNDGWVSFDAGVSADPFVVDHQPMRLDNLRAFAPDGSAAKIENSSTGRYRSTFDLHLTQPGTYRVVSETSGVSGTYTLNGEPHRVGGRGGPPPGGMAGAAGRAGGERPAGAPSGPGGPGGPGAPAGPPPESGGPDFKLPAGATEVKLSERVGRNEVYVTLGKPTAIKPAATGLTLLPLTHPADLVADEPARFRLYVDGKPATAATKVTVFPDGRRYRDANGSIEVTSDAKGEVLINWPAAGVYWISASASDAKGSIPGATERRLSYVTTVEVMAP